MKDHEILVVMHIQASKAQTSLHNDTVSTEPSLLAFTDQDVSLPTTLDFYKSMKNMPLLYYIHVHADGES